ncbi:MAG: transposase [Phaeodactylibacter sp.]|nr:transposase [Phaeodactylibacter sp.]
MDEAKCYEMLREVRWREGVKCPHCESDTIIKNGYDEVHLHRQRYYCQSCERNFDDLTNTVFSGSNKSLKAWVVPDYKTTRQPGQPHLHG